MGLWNWMVRKGNIGKTARAVAKGWGEIKEKNPKMTPRKIAETYVKIRYTVPWELPVAEKVLDKLPRNVNPINLSWVIFWFENQDEVDTLIHNETEWVQIMKEEIRKYGLEPGDFSAKDFYSKIFKS